LSRLACFSLALLLAGCGFQLQGALTTPPSMERTYIAAVDRHSGFYRELRAALQAAGVELVDSPTDATATFTINFDETAQRVLSVSARNVPTEYEVYYMIEYALDSGTEVLLEMQTLTVTRDYTYDSTLVLGKGKEEELLRQAIVDDLVRIVLKQISAL
jgi:LPS-assembly lipoprotein